MQPSRRIILAVGMTYAICGSREESNVYILLECPFAKKVWEARGVEERFWNGHFRSIDARLYRVGDGVYQ